MKMYLVMYIIIFW